MKKLNAFTLRRTIADPEERKKLPRNPIYIILDNVLDTYNIGAIFRLGDAVAVEKIIICGESETPPNHRIKKASINTTEWVPWEYAPTTLAAITKLRAQVPEIKIMAIEQAENSVPYTSCDYSFPVALIVGHETVGVSPAILAICDAVVELPMFGVNISLNVMVSLGIVLYEVVRHLKGEST